MKKKKGIFASVEHHPVVSVLLVVVGTITAITFFCGAVCFKVLELTRSSLSGSKRDYVHNAFYSVNVGVTNIPDGNVRCVIQLRPNTALPMHNFGAVLFPVLPALFLSVLEAFGSDAAR